MHLLKAPGDIIDYMIAHELYHLKIKGHSIYLSIISEFRFADIYLITKKNKSAKSKWNNFSLMQVIQHWLIGILRYIYCSVIISLRIIAFTIIINF
jgi:hypothetical protein